MKPAGLEVCGSSFNSSGGYSEGGCWIRKACGSKPETVYGGAAMEPEVLEAMALIVADVKPRYMEATVSHWDKKTKGYVPGAGVYVQGAVWTVSPVKPPRR